MAYTGMLASTTQQAGQQAAYFPHSRCQGHLHTHAFPPDGRPVAPQADARGAGGKCQGRGCFATQAGVSNACRPITYLCFKMAEELILSTVGSVCFSLVVFYCCQMQVMCLSTCIVFMN